MGAVLRFTTLLSSVLLAPILLKVLSIELFGVWMLFSSIVGVLTFADFGLGNSLINELVSSDTAVKVKKQEYLVSSTFFLLLFLCLILLISGLVFTLTLDLKTIFNIQSDISSRQLNIVFMIFIGSFAISMPFSVVQRVQTAFQETDISYLWQIMGHISAFALLLVVIKTSPNFTYLVGVYVIVPFIFIFINFSYQFFKLRPYLLPKLKNFRMVQAKLVATSGGLFFLLQILSIIGAYSDQIFISVLIGPEEVASYSVMQRLASSVLLAQFIFLPFWPAIGEALLRKDFNWVIKILNISLVALLLITSIIAIIYWFYAYEIIKLWLSDDSLVVGRNSTIFAFACWMLIATIGGLVSTVMNNPLFLKFHVALYFIATLVSVSLKVPLVEYYGISGAVWATTFSYGVIFIIPSLAYIYYFLIKSLKN